MFKQYGRESNQGNMASITLSKEAYLGSGFKLTHFGIAIQGSLRLSRMGSDLASLQRSVLTPRYDTTSRREEANCMTLACVSFVGSTSTGRRPRLTVMRPF